MTCSKRGCSGRTFMDSDRCFDHQRAGIGFGFGLWFAFCALVALGMLGLVGWAVIELVTWVTAK
jgi:hypothetical protein